MPADRPGPRWHGQGPGSAEVVRAAAAATATNSALVNADGTVWGELTTAVQQAGDSSVRAGGAWFQVKPKLGSGGIAGASIVRQGYIAAAGKYEIYPAVQPDAAGNAAVVFTLTNSARFPSAAYATLKAGGSNFGPGGRGGSGGRALQTGRDQRTALG